MPQLPCITLMTAHSLKACYPSHQSQKIRFTLTGLIHHMDGVHDCFRDTPRDQSILDIHGNSTLMFLPSIQESVEIFVSLSSNLIYHLANISLPSVVPQIYCRSHNCVKTVRKSQEQGIYYVNVEWKLGLVVCFQSQQLKWPTQEDRKFKKKKRFRLDCWMFLFQS